MKKSLLKTLTLVFLCLFFVGCQRTLGSTEKGMRYWLLPTFLGGGLSGNLFQNSQTVFEIPLISTLYTFDTGEKVIVLGPQGGAEDFEGYIRTRALDGNEVALAMTIRYKFDPNAEQFVYSVYNVGTDPANIRAMVEATARADIRTFMNEIRTADFISGEARYQAVDVVKQALKNRLREYGIHITQVNLDDFKFWRAAADGTLDRSYEDILKRIQQTQEDIKRERARYDTLRNKKQRELTEEEAKAKRLVEEAKGFLAQQSARGDAYRTSKVNEAEGIRVLGDKEVKAIQLQVKALSGPGGDALLRLEIAEQLLKAKPNFVVLSDAESGSGLELRKIDTNRLLEQLAVVEATRETAPAAPRKENAAESQ